MLTVDSVDGAGAAPFHVVDEISTAVAIVDERRRRYPG